MPIRITINGKVYGSPDEVPEGLRELVREGVERELADPPPGGRITIRRTFRIGAGEAVPEALLPPLQKPVDYRRRAEEMQSGRIPVLHPLEPLLAPVFALLIVAALISIFLDMNIGGRDSLVSAFVQVLVVAASVAGLVRLRDRRRRRELYPFFRDCAGRLPGAFVTVVRGTPILSFAREDWNGSAAFFRGSRGNPAHSRLDARLAAGAPRLVLRARRLLDGLFTPADAVVTGDGEFDKRFLVASPDHSFALALMDSARRACILRLAAHGAPELLVTGGFMQVKVGRNLARAGHGARMVANGEALFGFLSDAALLVDSASRLVRPSPAPAPPPALQ